MVRHTSQERSRPWIMNYASCSNYDISWTRRAVPGEVTYSLTIRKDGDDTHVEFRLGDLAIDPEGREWHQAYVDSRELEKIKELVEANDTRK